MSGKTVKGTLSISRAHFPVTTLGPGKRLGIWVQGCSIRCPGCISADTWSFESPTAEVDALHTALQPWLNEAAGITVTGGEPFDQADALIAFIKLVKQSFAGDVLIFSGYSAEKIAGHLESLAGYVDAVVTGPYDVDAPQTLALRGSDNQRLHLLTPLGQARFARYERTRTAEDDRLDFMIDVNGTAWMAGIPRKGDIVRLVEMLRADGTTAATPVARSTHTS